MVLATDHSMLTTVTTVQQEAQIFVLRKFTLQQLQ